jgi:GTP pyrophosphokinase
MPDAVNTPLPLELSPRAASRVATLRGLGLDDHAIQAAALLEADNDTLAAQTTDTQALVAGVHKMALIHSLPREVKQGALSSAAQVESLRKMLLAMVADIRIVVIKLAERLAVLKDASQCPTEPSSIETAREVLDLFSPLANRLGLWQVKWALEDLSLRILEPSTYQTIAKSLDVRRAEREHYMLAVKADLLAECQTHQLNAEVTARAKHIYSIWAKLKRKGYRFEQLYDIHAVRILVDSVGECYTALGIVHNLWTPIASEFDDYIAKPKSNGYRSLHTAVVGPDGKAVEVQIRTRAMHQASEYGVAAHWLYKEGGFDTGKHTADPMQDKLAWLRQVIEWKKDDSLSPDDSTAETLHHLKANLFEDTIFVLTPVGQVIDLPKDATPIDFAYALHTNLGHRCRGAKVNGTMVPLNYPLSNGQRVEVITIKEGGPSRDWLNTELHFVRSNRARSKIRAWFNALAQEDQLSQGRAILERELQREGKTSLALERVAKAAGLAQVDELLKALAKAEINHRELVQAINEAGQTEPVSQPEIDELEVHTSRAGHRNNSGGVLIVGVDNLLTLLAGCCKPAPPDQIIGFITRGKGISIHRHDCVNIAKMQADKRTRLTPADWGKQSQRVFPVDIRIVATDRAGLLRDISDVFAKERAHIISASSQRKQNQSAQQAQMQFTVEISDVGQLNRTLQAVTQLKGVLAAERR